VAVGLFFVHSCCDFCVDYSKAFGYDHFVDLGLRLGLGLGVKVRVRVRFRC
jgi:hypothetical protein